MIPKPFSHLHGALYTKECISWSLEGRIGKRLELQLACLEGALAPFFISLGRSYLPSMYREVLLASPLLSSLLPAMEWIMINVHRMQPVHIITRPDCLVISLICRPFVSWLLYFWPFSSQHPQFSQTKLNHTPAVPQKSLLSQALYLWCILFFRSCTSLPSSPLPTPTDFLS